jgi:hypothetical protein
MVRVGYLSSLRGSPSLLRQSLPSGPKAMSPTSADTAPPPGTPETVSADWLPAWQINGVVWSQVPVGNAVYATGRFTQARPPGTATGSPQEVDRAIILAYDITAGILVTSFEHSLTAQGLVATSPDGSMVYRGGHFTTVDGITRNHIAASLNRQKPRGVGTGRALVTRIVECLAAAQGGSRRV